MNGQLSALDRHADHHLEPGGSPQCLVYYENLPWCARRPPACEEPAPAPGPVLKGTDSQEIRGALACGHSCGCSMSPCRSALLGSTEAPPGSRNVTTRPRYARYRINASTYPAKKAPNPTSVRYSNAESSAMVGDAARAVIAAATPSPSAARTTQKNGCGLVTTLEPKRGPAPHRTWVQLCSALHNTPPSGRKGASWARAP